MPNMPQSPVKLAQHRPAETSGVVGAVVMLIAKAFGVTDPDTLIALGVVVGAVPAIVTALILLIQKRNGSSQGPPQPPPQPPQP